MRWRGVVDQVSLSERGSVQIPREVSEFIQRETFSLLIKGGAGTGKTTLALSILRDMGVTGNVLFVSTRTSPTQLLRNHPWVGAQLNMQESRNVNGSEGNAKARLVDGRLDEPNVLFERIGTILMDAPSPWIVIDSIDPIAELMDEDAIYSNLRVLQSWRERAKARLLVTSEWAADRTFDPNFDGVVELRKGYFRGRIMRRARLSKLLGVRIQRPDHCFSLKGGVFQSFGPGPMAVTPSTWQWRRQGVPRTGGEAGAVRMSMAHVNELIVGGLPIGSGLEVEVEGAVPASNVLGFALSLFADYARGGNPVVVFSAGLLREHAVKAGLSVLPPLTQPTRVKYAGGDGGATEQGLEREVDEAKTNRGAGGFLALMDLGPNDRVDTGRMFSFVRRNSGAAVFLRKVDPRDSEKRRPPSDYRFRLLSRSGTLLFYSDIPWSPLFAVVPREDGSRLDLEQIS